MSKAHTSEFVINEIRRLSQEEGYKDNEIADVIGYHRITILRIRQKNGIPSYNKEARLRRNNGQSD